MAVTLNGESFSLSDFRGLGHSATLPAGNGQPAQPRFPDRVFSQMLVELEKATQTVNSTSTDSLAIASSGSISPNIGIGKNFAIGARLRLSRTSNPTTHYMEGILTAYTSSTGASSITLDNSLGSGVYSAWSIGIAGDKGETGSVWRSGSGAPSNSLGDDGDFYIDTATADVYQKASGTYSVVINIMGATGGGLAAVVNDTTPELGGDLDALGFAINNVRGYNAGATVQGELADGLIEKRFYFTSAARVYKVKAKLLAGTITLQLRKNGSQVISFSASPSETIPVTTSLVEHTISEGGDAYVQFAQGDYIDFTLSSNASAYDLLVLFDVRENFA